MPYSYLTTAGTGSQTNFAFSFPYLAKADIHVFVNEVENFTFTFVNASTVQILPAPGSGIVVKIQRITPIQNLAVDFANGSVMNEADLDNGNLQSLYAEQENNDFLTQTLLLDTDGTINAQNKRIKNVATPTATQDAATKAYVDASMAGTPGGHSIGSHNDTVAITVAAGTIMAGNSSGPSKLEAQPIGNDLDTLEVKLTEPRKLRWLTLAAKLFQLLTTKGDLAVSDGTTVVRLPRGTDGQRLETLASEATGLKWVTDVLSILKSVVTTAGDLIVATASGVVTRLGVGSAGAILVSDPTPSEKIAWKAVGTIGKVLRVFTNNADKLKYQFVGLGETVNGFRCRTHPDAAQAASKIWIDECKYLCTNRGTMVRPRPNQVVDITASGAGGLDTGSEAASTWYSLHYIFKGGDSSSPDDPDAPSADAYMLHREKNYLLDEDFFTGDDLSVLLRRSTGPTQTELAQGFRVDNTGVCPFIDTRLIRVGAVVGNVWLEIRADSSGNPGSTLATSDKYNAARLSTTATNVEFVFRSTNLVTLTATTQYHMVLAGDYTASDTINVCWRVDSTAPAYGNGSFKGLDTGTWVDKGYDGMFRVYIVQNSAAITLPTGYTESCLVGFVRNDGSSNFVPYTQTNRTIMRSNGGDATVGAGTTANLVRLDSILPPVHIECGTFEIWHSAASIYRMGHPQCLDVTNATTLSIDGLIGAGNSTSGATAGPIEQRPFAGIPDTLGVMCAQSGTGNMFIGEYTF